MKAKEVATWFLPNGFAREFATERSPVPSESGCVRTYGWAADIAWREVRSR